MTHRWPIRVYYEDTDLAGIVYYANYLKFVERARSEMVREAGIDQVAMKAEGLVFAVTRVDADYIQAAKYDDQLFVETTLDKVTPARFVMGQTVLRDGKAIFKAVVTVACLDAAGRPARLPQAVRDLA